MIIHRCNVCGRSTVNILKHKLFACHSKSDTVKRWAKEHGHKVIDIRIRKEK